MRFSMTNAALQGQVPLLCLTIKVLNFLKYFTVENEDPVYGTFLSLRIDWRLNSSF